MGIKNRRFRIIQFLKYPHLLIVIHSLTHMPVFAQRFLRKENTIMLREQTEKIISKAIQEQTNKKASIYKARKGYKIVQVPLIPGVVTTVDEDKDQRILGTGFFWSETDELKLYYALEIPEDQATPLIRDFEREKDEYRRAHRCRIWNKKRTKKIMCPFTNTCSKCPFREHPEEIFPSEAEEQEPLSFDEVNQDKLSMSPDSFGSKENMNLSVEMEEMMAKLQSLEDKTLYILGSLLNLQYEVKEIQEYLNLDDDSMKSYATEYIAYYHNYID